MLSLFSPPLRPSNWRAPEFSNVSPSSSFIVNPRKGRDEVQDLVTVNFDDKPVTKRELKENTPLMHSNRHDINKNRRHISLR